MIVNLQPAIYKLVYNKKTKEVQNSGYQLVPYKQKFIIIGKNYGDIDKHVNIFWNRFLSGPGNMGIMLTGAAGSGKTRVAEILGNLGVDNNMCVVLIADVDINPDIISFIDSLHNMIIIFDEFSKNFNSSMQNKMLTMLSATGPAKNMFILTENDRFTVSKYIRTRPGRIRYAVDYDRIKESVIDDYCLDYGVPDDFKEDILKIHSTASKFTFDHLQALVSEKVATPDANIEDLMEILNLDDLIIEDTWKITNVVSESDLKPRTILSTVRTLNKRQVNSKYMEIYVTVDNNPPSDNPNSVPDPVRISCTVNDIYKIQEDDTRVYRTNGYVVYLTKMVHE